MVEFEVTPGLPGVTKPADEQDAAMPIPPDPEMDALRRQLEIKAGIRRYAQEQLDRAASDLYDTLFECLARGMTQAEAADLMGVSRIRVGQIVKEYQAVLEKADEKADG